MISEWTSHLKNPSEIEDFKRTVRQSRPVLDRLKQIVEKKEKAMDIQELSLESYNSPSWGYRQAHQNGFKQALASFKILINIDQESTNDPKQPIRAARGPTRTA